MPTEIVHFELLAQDADRAQGFWSGMFGWEFQDSGMPNMDYRMAQAGDRMGAAISQSDTKQGYPNIYFDVDDIEAAIAKTRDLGGSADEKMPVPGMGWFASARDTEGNAFSLWQADSAAGQ